MQTEQGSFSAAAAFSAVSKPNFARKYALESSRRVLHNALLCAVLESNPKNTPFSTYSKLNFFSKIAEMFASVLPHFSKLIKISLDVGQILPELLFGSQKCRK